MASGRSAANVRACTSSRPPAVAPAKQRYEHGGMTRPLCGSGLRGELLRQVQQGGRRGGREHARDAKRQDGAALDPHRQGRDADEQIDHAAGGLTGDRDPPRCESRLCGIRRPGQAAPVTGFGHTPSLRVPTIRVDAKTPTQMRPVRSGRSERPARRAGRPQSQEHEIPGMKAVKTFPRAMKLIASTAPEATVRATERLSRPAVGGLLRAIATIVVAGALDQQEARIAIDEGSQRGAATP